MILHRYNPRRDWRPLACLCGLLIAGCPFDVVENMPSWLAIRRQPPNGAALAFNAGDEPTPLLAEGQPLFVSQPIFVSIPGKTGVHAPTLAAFDDGTLLAAWYAYDGPRELDGAAIYIARRPAGQPIWDPPSLHIDRPAVDGNPVLYAEGDAVWLFQAVAQPAGWSTAHIELQRSFDRGHTWTDPQSIGTPSGANVRFPPVRTAAGTLLLPAYSDLVQRSLFYASGDGDNWSLRASLSIDILAPNLQPSVARLADGSLLAVARNGAGGWLWVTRSDDDGHSWVSPADSGFPNPGSPAALLMLSSGNLILLFNDSNASRRPLSIAASADEGRTWQPPRVLVDGEDTYSYPTVVQTSDRQIHVVYSHGRSRIGHITLNESWLVD